MNRRQKIAREIAKKRGTKKGRETTMKMNAGFLSLSYADIFPNQLDNVEYEPEHVQFLQCVWGEARGESIEGIKAVANVIMNRYKARRSYFGYTIRDIVLKHDDNGNYQFCAMNPENVNYDKMLNPDLNSWLKVAVAALPFYFGAEPVLPETCYYYTTLDTTYFDNNDKVIECARIGNHKFYMDK